MTDVLGCKMNECDQTWEDLEKVDDTKRYCTRCAENVYRVNDSDEFYEHTRKKHCVAVFCEDRILLGDVAPFHYGIDASEIGELDDDPAWIKQDKDI